MPLAPAITDIEQLKDRPTVADLLAWRADAVEGARFDRNELTIYIAREAIRAQSLAHAFGDHPIIFDKQDSHGIVCSWLRDARLQGRGPILSARGLNRT